VYSIVQIIMLHASNNIMRWETATVLSICRIHNVFTIAVHAPYAKWETVNSSQLFSVTS